MKQKWSKDEMKIMKRLVKRNISTRDIFMADYFPGKTKPAIDSCYNRVSMNMIKAEIRKLKEFGLTLAKELK